MTPPRLEPARRRNRRASVLPATALALALGVVGLAPPAAAQQEPPSIHGFVEPCTVGFVQDGNNECELCAPTGGNWQACARTLGARGYTKRCRTSVHSAPGEVWCTARLVAPKDNAPSPLLLTLAAAGALGGFAALLRWREKRS
jgi:hypothetical protein